MDTMRTTLAQDQLQCPTYHLARIWLSHGGTGEEPHPPPSPPHSVRALLCDQDEVKAACVAELFECQQSLSAQEWLSDQLRDLLATDEKELVEAMGLEEGGGQ